MYSNVKLLTVCNEFTVQTLPQNVRPSCNRLDRENENNACKLQCTVCIADFTLPCMIKLYMDHGALCSATQMDLSVTSAPLALQQWPRRRRRLPPRPPSWRPQPPG